MSELLKDRYELLGKLGSGGFSTVFRARDTLLDREVAVKILKASLHEDEELVHRFLLEAKLTSKLSHPNTLTVHDFGRDEEGHCFFVTELLVGKSLYERIQTTRIEVIEALSIADQVMLALNEAHSKEIVHRDIKPGNIFVLGSNSRSVQAKLLDFGIAKSVGMEGQTVTGQMMGTPTYMSPEQIVNIKEVDHRTDLYSLGVVLSHMLNGYPPFKGESYWDTMRMHMQDPIPPLKLIAPEPHITPEVERDIQALLIRLMAKSKHKRHASAEEAHQHIQAIILDIERRERGQGAPAKVRSKTTLDIPLPLMIEDTETSPTPAFRKGAKRGAKQSSPSHESSKSGLFESEDSKAESFSFLNESSQEFQLSLSADGDDDLSAKERRPTSNDSLKGAPSPYAAAPVDPFARLEAEPNAGFDSHAKLRSDLHSGAQVNFDSDPHLKQSLSASDLAARERSIAGHQTTGHQTTGHQTTAPARTHSSMVLILDPSEFVAGMYRDGLIKESERRVRRATQPTAQQTPQQGDQWDTWSARRSAQGPLPLSVSLYTDERDLFADLDWGADLIILDLKTRNPADETEGITLIRELRDRIPETSHLIAICHDRSLTLEATEAGADAVLVKPVRNRQLFEAAAAYL